MKIPSRSACIIFLAGGLLALLVWSGSNMALEQTNSLEFCVSCHEMEHTVYQEYKESVHFRNASGVNAECADCHVPKALGPKLVRKIKAVTEVYHALKGTIDTPEKFEEKRLELAERVWAEMEANDSRECRNCHSYQHMDFTKQSRRGREKMEPAEKKQQTCIECHKGIAHNLPVEEDD